MRRVQAVAAAIVLTLLLSGCGPSAEQIVCEQAGGQWETYIVTYTTTMVYNGKGYTPMLTPLYGARCVGGAS